MKSLVHSPFGGALGVAGVFHHLHLFQKKLYDARRREGEKCVSTDCLLAKALLIMGGAGEVYMSRLSWGGSAFYHWEQVMESGWLFGLGTIFATLVGPILAVQIQKYLERTGEDRRQKMWIFSTLMATRAATLAADHVRALNMIDLAFNGGRLRRGKTETDVLDAWREYLDHLNTHSTEANVVRWIERKQELLVLLLSSMAADLDLRYDRVLLRNGAYIPKGHSDLENDQNLLRQLALKVLSGEQPLRMNVTDFPFSVDLAESQQRLQDALASALSEHGYVNVRVIPD